MPKCLNFKWNHKIPESARDSLVRPQACHARVSTLFQNVSMSISMTTFRRCVDKRKLLSICFYDTIGSFKSFSGDSPLYENRARETEKQICHAMTSLRFSLSSRLTLALDQSSREKSLCCRKKEIQVAKSNWWSDITHNTVYNVFKLYSRTLSSENNAKV